MWLHNKYIIINNRDARTDFIYDPINSLRTHCV